MKKIRVAYLIDTINSAAAGTEKQLIETIKRIDRRRFDPMVICLYGSKWLERNSLPCRSILLGYKGFFSVNFPRVILRLRSALVRERVSILQTFFMDSIFVGFIAASLLASRPVLISSRRDIGLGNSVPWYHALFELVLPFVNKGFDGIVCNSFNVRDHTVRKERTSAAKIKVLTNGVDIPPSLEPQPELFRRFPAALWIAIVANLKPVKRIDLFLNALALLKDTPGCPSFHAVILGEGPERPSLEALSRQLGLDSRVHFQGAVTNASYYLQQVDIGVLCSDREGLSNAILEYMAAGLPVVATSVGGTPELVDQSNGACTPAGDSAALARALVSLVCSPELRKSKGSKSFERARNHFSWEKSIAATEVYYTELVYKVRM
jgi:glycosyltransferase involved in cell wall biosynthesis